MQTIDIAQLRTRATEIGQQLIAPDQIVVTITAALLVVVFLLAIGTIWRGRRRTTVALPPASNPSGFKRWLTPMGMKSIPAEQAVAARMRRKSGSNKTIKVSTPVSRVSSNAWRSPGHSLRTRRSLSRTNRRATSTARPPRKFSACSID